MLDRRLVRVPLVRATLALQEEFGLDDVQLAREILDQDRRSGGREIRLGGVQHAASAALGVRAALDRRSILANARHERRLLAAVVGDVSAGTVAADPHAVVRRLHVVRGDQHLDLGLVVPHVEINVVRRGQAGPDGDSRPSRATAPGRLRPVPVCR